MNRPNIAVGMFVFMTFAGSVLAADARPIALAGASYGRYEVDSLCKNVLAASADMEYVFEKRGEWIPPAEFEKYGLVIIAHSLERTWTADDAAVVGRYLEGGGHLLLVNLAPASLTKDIGLDKVPWLGMKRCSWVREGIECTVLKPDHPFVRGVFDANPSPPWLKASTFAFPAVADFENVIGSRDGACLVGMRKVGKGWVAYAGTELFRLKGTIKEQADSYIRVLRNIVAEAGPATSAMLRAQALESAQAYGAPVVLWNREWIRGEEYGPRFLPPMPAPDEQVRSLHADMALDEYETLQLNVTPLTNVGEANWSFESDRFPLQNVRLFVQERPDPIPWPKDPALAREAPYWLMPPEYVDPRGKSQFSTVKGETRILWIKVSSFGVAPGDYRVALDLSFANGPAVSVPISLSLYPVRMPRRRLISLEAAGQVYGDVNDPEPALRFTRNLESHGFEWTLVNAWRTEFVRLVGEPQRKFDVKLVTEIAQRLKNGNAPMADFSALDPWMEQAIGHGLVNVSTGSTWYYLDGVLRNSALDEADRDLVRTWFAREAARYLREKGVRLAVASIGDELGEEEIRERWLPWAIKMHQAGWDCTSTFSGEHHLKPEVNDLIYPYVKLWTLNRSLMPSFVTKLRNGALRIRDDAILGTYGAGEGRGSEHRKPLSASRFLGWESWMWGIRNCAPNPYFKGWIYYADYTNRDLGVAGERFVSYIKKDDLAVPLADCPFLEGIREGMEEGNLCAILTWYLERMGAAGGKSAEKARDVRQRLAKVVGNSPDCVLRWKEEASSRLPVRRFEATNEDFRRAKRAVLDLLAEIRPDALQTVRPSLYWNDVPLVRDGVPVCAVYVDKVPAEALLDRARDLCGVELPAIASATSVDARYETAILVGSGAQNRLTAATLSATGEQDATEAYPGTASYFIRERAGGDGKRLLMVAGPDAAGTQKGVRMFAAFLRSEGAWLVP